MARSLLLLRARQQNNNHNTGDMSSPLVGIEWAGSIDSEFKNNLNQIPLVELIPDNFFQYNSVQEKTLQQLNMTKKPVILHSVSLSLMSLEPLKKEYFKKILDVANKLSNVICFSDHLCMTELNGDDIGQLTSSVYNDETLQVCTEKILEIQNLTGQAFSIENIAHPFFIPDQTYKETEFINKLIEQTNCNLLLDLNNLYTNAINFSVAPTHWLQDIDLDKVSAIHLAGGYIDEEGILQDGHCEPVPEPVWDLYRYIIKKSKRSIPTIIERTGNNGNSGIKPILEDMKLAKEIQSLYMNNHSQPKAAAV